MNQILIRSVLLDDRFSDVLIEGNVFKAIAPAGTLRTTEPDAMDIESTKAANTKMQTAETNREQAQ